MAGWSITRRITTITLALLACIVLVSAMGIGAVQRLSAIFHDYRDATENVRIATDLFGNVFEAEIEELQFRQSPTDDGARAVLTTLERFDDQRDVLLGRLAARPDLAEIAQDIFEHEDGFHAGFDEARRRQAERDAAVDAMGPLWDELTRGLSTLDNLMMFAGNQRASTNLDVARHNLLTGRIHVELFLLTNAEEDMRIAGEHFRLARERVSDSRAVLTDEARLAELDRVIGAIDAYWSTFAQAVDAILKRNVARATLDALSEAMAADIDRLLDAVATTQEALGQESDRVKWLTLVSVVIAGIAALGAGYMLARRIARRTTGDIETSVEQMRSLAEGNLELEITGAEHDHELGQMARTLEIFRQNARAAETLRAEQAAQEREAELRDAEAARREKHLDEERARKVEEARAAMIRELTQAVGAVVEAGAEGDFSRRIDTRFDSDELNELARGINALVTNVDSGIAETARVMAAMATGDLSDRMTGAFRGTFAELQGNVNETIGQLARLVTEIAGQCDRMAVAAGQMTGQASDLSRRAEQQAASLEETSAAMEEISASARSSAEGASSAAEFARKTSGQVDEAGAVVASAVNAMSDIRNASGRINEIVAVIDGIAFQTNLLALNASVEAARAGSAGKGFAVVATEVRALAQRSGEASKDIKALIDESSAQVERGVTLVERTGTTLDEIMVHVGKMADTMQSLTTSAREQATGVGEVTAAITQLDAITQKNAALSDQSRSSAASVQELSDSIREMVARFRVAGEDAGGDGQDTHVIAAE